jgi:hypothetical protein
MTLHSWNFGLAVSYLEGEPEATLFVRYKTLGDPAVEWQNEHFGTIEGVVRAGSSRENLRFFLDE